MMPSKGSKIIDLAEKNMTTILDESQPFLIEIGLPRNHNKTVIEVQEATQTKQVKPVELNSE
ncbi:MAG: hypothetical protein F6K42_13130 [Leptolyngbya sp. SIO1D8]|nr:hypothetical protein [Leptolyngbya sp. SIO1D8]